VPRVHISMLPMHGREDPDQRRRVARKGALLSFPFVFPSAVLLHVSFCEEGDRYEMVSFEEETALVCCPFSHVIIPFKQIRWKKSNRENTADFGGNN